MKQLYDLGIDEGDIKLMLEEIEYLVDIPENEVVEKIEILRFIECSEKQIKHIIISNPQFLICSNRDILELIRKLNELGIKNLNLFFESNPYFLNKDVSEIEDYINERIEKKEILVDIISDIENNPFVIDEY